MTDSLPSSSLQGDARTAALRNANACQQMADLCNELHAFAPELAPREFLRTLGALVAGIDLGLKGFEQLARGGSNGLIGAGFRTEYDDGTAGQARHFAGTAAAAALLGDKPAELLAHHLVDPAESIDGHLSTAALEFARLLVDGELPLDTAADWIETHICDPDFEPAAGFTPFDVFSDRAPEAEALRARFTPEQWQALCNLPEQVVVAAALSDATGDFDDARDLVAGIRQLDAAWEHPNILVRAVVAERLAGGLEWTDASRSPADYVDKTLQAVGEQVACLRSHDIPAADIEAYANLLWSIAKEAVRGSKTGGVLGLGGQHVSAPEARFLDRLDTLLESNLPGCDGCLS